MKLYYLKLSLKYYLSIFHQQLALRIMWASMDVIHTLIDMVYTMLLLYKTIILYKQ
jgi:hypothetical protein